MGRSNWEETNQTALAIPFEQLQPGTSMMEVVRSTMKNFYCNPEDRAIVR